MSSYGTYKPKPKSKKSTRGPIKRRPSYQRRHLMKNISQSIQAHINRLAQPVVRNPMSQSPFAFLRQRLMAVKKPESPVEWMQGLRPGKKLKKRKGKRSRKARKPVVGRPEKEIGPANLQQTKGFVLPAQLSVFMMNYEKARLQFLESLTQIQKQVSNLQLPAGLSEKAYPLSRPKIKRPPPKNPDHNANLDRPKTVISGVKLAPPPTKGLPPRPGTPMVEHSGNVKNVLGPKLRRLISNAANKSLPAWSTC